MIAKLDALEQVKRLNSAGYSLSRGATAEGVASLWTETLDVRSDELRSAVSVYVRKGGRFFPKPGELLDIVRDLRSEQGGRPSDLRSKYLAWEQHQQGPCPVCAAVIQLVTAEQRGGVSEGAARYGILHDFREHQDARVPHVGWPHRKITRDDDTPDRLRAAS